MTRARHQEGLKATSHRRSFTIKQKLAAVDAIKTLGIIEAARSAGCSTSSLGEWRKQKLALASTDDRNKRKRVRSATPKTRSAEVDEAVFGWFEEQRALNNGVSGEMLCYKARDIAVRLGVNDFTGGRGWYRHFMKRHDLSLRMKTTMSPQLPADMKVRVKEWHEKVMRIRSDKNIHQLQFMANMDETPLLFDMPYTRTIAPKGSKKVAIRTAGGEKKRLTVVLTIFADGSKAKPLVIFRGKRLGKVKVPDGVAVLMHPKAWNSDEGMQTWLKSCFIPHLQGIRKVSVPSDMMLTMDLFKPHVAADVTKELEKNAMVPCIIPAGITSLVQPLDVSINKSFKQRMRNKWAQWMTESDGKTFTKGGNMRCPSKELMLRWVVDCWSTIPSDMIIKSFKGAGISQLPDGSEDHLMWNREDSVEESDDESDSEDGMNGGGMTNVSHRDMTLYAF